MTIEEKQIQKADSVAGFVQEDNGNYSCTRLMSLVSLFVSIWFAYITLHLPQDNGTGIYVTFAFLTAAFAPKLVQKFAEEKLPPFRGVS